MDKPKAYGPLRRQPPSAFLVEQRARILREAREDNLGSPTGEYLQEATGSIVFTFERGRKFGVLPPNADTQPRPSYHDNH